MTQFPAPIIHQLRLTVSPMGDVQAFDVTCAGLWCDIEKLVDNDKSIEAEGGPGIDELYRLLVHLATCEQQSYGRDIFSELARKATTGPVVLFQRLVFLELVKFFLGMAGRDDHSSFGDDKVVNLVSDFSRKLKERERLAGSIVLTGRWNTGRGRGARMNPCWGRWMSSRRWNREGRSSGLFDGS